MVRWARFFITILLGAIFLSGLAILGISAYAAVVRAISGALASFAFFGVILTIFSLLGIFYFHFGVNSFQINGNSFAIGDLTGGENSPEFDEQQNEEAILLLEHISDQLSKIEDSEYPEEGHFIDSSIRHINRLLAIENYTEHVGDEGLRVVKYENQFVTARSDGPVNLSKGLHFNVLSTDEEENRVRGRIGTAELIETESTSGILFQFRMIEWRQQDEDWQTEAVMDLKDGNAIMTVKSETNVSIRRTQLETTLNCLQEIKRSMELEYEY